MKVDLGTCAVCGAKNSKFVEKCYKCGAALPWAPGYVAPKTPVNTPSPSPHPKPQQKPVHPSNTNGNEVKTVVSPPLDLSDLDKGKTSLPGSVSERAKRSVSIPTWAIGLGGAGCVALGIALMMAFGNRNTPAPTVAPATPVPTSAVPTSASTPTSSATPVVTPTSLPTPVPTVIAPPVPTTPAPTAAPVVAAEPPIRVGPSFEEVDQKMDDRSTTWTDAQKQTYWQSVAGSTIRWTGVVVDARLSGGGQISLRCGKQTISSDVQVSMDGTQLTQIGQISKGERITIEGILEDHSSMGYSITRGKIVGRG